MKPWLCPFLFATALAAAQDRVPLIDFESGIPGNKAGEPYVSQYEGEGGKARVSLMPGAGVHGGSCVRFEVTQGFLYAQFNAHNADGTRGFAREYVAGPDKWKFDTYNRMRFWIRCPAGATPLDSGGRGSIQFGTYCKRVGQADTHSDEAGGGHWYHHLNLPNAAAWTQVIINAHPHHFRGTNGRDEEKNQPHPTGESGYNYFDAMTRFYVNETHTTAAAGAPLAYDLDDFEFYRERFPENDEQIYSLTGTYVPKDKRFILTWSRDKDQNDLKHEVRYSDRDIHEAGWDAAKRVPGGLIAPPGSQGYNGMVWSGKLKGASGKVYFAIKPEGAKLFSQIAVDTAP
jgi:hypothetical protein